MPKHLKAISFSKFEIQNKNSQLQKEKYKHSQTPKYTKNNVIDFQ